MRIPDKTKFTICRADENRSVFSEGVIDWSPLEFTPCAGESVRRIVKHHNYKYYSPWYTTRSKTGRWERHKVPGPDKLRSCDAPKCRALKRGIRHGWPRSHLGCPAAHFPMAEAAHLCQTAAQRIRALIAVFKRRSRAARAARAIIGRQSVGTSWLRALCTCAARGHHLIRRSMAARSLIIRRLIKECGKKHHLAGIAGRR